MAEQLSTPVIRLVNMLASPVIRLVEVSGNILESCKVTSPHGREDECAKFIISDIEDAYGLREIMTIGDEYTLSFWLKSDVSGYVRTSGEGTFKASSEWQKCVVTFETDCEDLVLSFDTEGTYYIYHIQLELGNTATDYRPATEDVDEGISTAQKTAEDAQEKARQNAEALASAVEEFQDQIDAHVMIWYGEGAPTSNNPDLKWEDAETKALHKGDMYYDTQTGYAYRWEFESSAYSWKQIEDQDVKKALEDSAKAQGSADQKRRVFVTQPEPPYDEGDLWLNDGELYSCIKPKTEGVYEDGDFKVAVKYTNELNLFKGQYANELKAINDQIDKKAETWYQEEDPSSAWTTDELRAVHVGDFWYNTKENKSYIYRFSKSSADLADTVDGKLATPYITINGYGWKESDGVPQSVYDKIDKKAQIFSDKPTHPYYVKDLWVEGKDGDIKVCIENSTEEGFKAEHWVLASRYMGNAELQNWITQKYNPVIQEVKLQLDGKAETWCQTTDPSLEWTGEAKNHVGDLWHNPNIKESYIYTASGASDKTSEAIDGKLAAPSIALYTWVPSYEIPQQVFEDIDGKAQIFASKPIDEAYYINDLWVEGSKGDIKVCISDRDAEKGFQEDDWVKASKYTDDTLATQVKLTVDGLTITDENGTTLIDGNSIDVETLFARDIIASGSISGLTYVSESNIAGVPTRMTLDGATLRMREEDAGTLNSLFVQAHHSEYITEFKPEQLHMIFYLKGNKLYQKIYHLDTEESFTVFETDPHANDNTGKVTLCQTDIKGDLNVQDGVVTAPKFVGSLDGSATKDGKGNVIDETYLPLTGGIVRSEFGDTDQSVYSKLLVDAGAASSGPLSFEVATSGATGIKRESIQLFDPTVVNDTDTVSKHAKMSFDVHNGELGGSSEIILQDSMISINAENETDTGSSFGIVSVAANSFHDGYTSDSVTLSHSTLDSTGKVVTHRSITLDENDIAMVADDPNGNSRIFLDGDVAQINANQIAFFSNSFVINGESALTALLGYTPSYIQVRTTADETTWSSSHQYMYPFCADAAPSTWSSVKGNLSLDTQVVSFGDRENVTVYGVRVGANIHMVKVNASVYYSSASETVTGVAASIYRLQDGKNVIFSQAFTHVDSGNGTYGTCSPSAIMAVKEGDFIFIGGWKSTANRDINTPAGSGRTNMIVEAIG